MSAPAAASARMVLRFPDAATATQAMLALDPDNAGHCTVDTDGPLLVVEASSQAPLGVLRTLDDVLACLRAAYPDL